MRTHIKKLVSNVTCNIKFLIFIVLSLSILVWYKSPLIIEKISNHSVKSDEVVEITNENAYLRSIVPCNDRDFKFEIQQRGKYVVLKNYIRASHGNIKCYDSVTYTTHGDFTFLDNVSHLVSRWFAPISIAVYAPGRDFELTLQTIHYLRQCQHIGQFIEKFVTFHIYFEEEHLPKTIPKDPKELNVTETFCVGLSPWTSIKAAETYRHRMKLMYPVNVGRNIARDAALTHFILASDIELYPNPGVERAFMEMIARRGMDLSKNPRVYPLAVFEVEKSIQPPGSKSSLITLLKSQKALPFHHSICQYCHEIPEYDRWQLHLSNITQLDVFHIGKRIGKHSIWEPIFIGTRNDPHYEESISWEGKRDKMTQGYIMCTLDYEFHILDNAFLVHKSGIKTHEFSLDRVIASTKTEEMMKNQIRSKLKVLYGDKNNNCTLL